MWKKIEGDLKKSQNWSVFDLSQLSWAKFYVNYYFSVNIFGISLNFSIKPILPGFYHVFISVFKGGGALDKKLKLKFCNLLRFLIQVKWVYFLNRNIILWYNRFMWSECLFLIEIPYCDIIDLCEVSALS